jgi:hypothetical protein
VGGPELVGFIASFAGQMAGMAARQEAGPVPALAAEANARSIEAYGVLEESADLQLEGMSGGTESVRSGTLAEGQRLFDEGIDLLNEARKDVERLRGRCSPEG